ncbi:hypothetical protein [Herbidospora sp. NBRC 101105]|uniref:hypothetical protein n=1 Tax=Herbidospora sp. NBRC 101105 TaxID=3032195 RepID=UPI0024A090BA|nr:hypothetical protein [Herbidospora sp. NBRC 101105]GLX94222.1 hypothetical protein Hesp01_21720 [Herbidospora sp. NBRC 101105]
MRRWSVLVSLAAVLLAGAPPAHAETPVPNVTVAAGVAQPPSHTGSCYPEPARITLSATITVDGPRLVSYRWGTGRTEWVDFTEAGSRTVTTTKTHYWGFGPKSETIRLTGIGGTATIAYTLACDEPVPHTPEIQPAATYLGPCGASVVHTATAQITSPIAQTVRYRWITLDGADLRGAEGVHEVVFTEPGTRTVSTPFHRLPVASPSWNDWISLRIVGPETHADLAYWREYSTRCAGDHRIGADFASLTRTAGTCSPWTPFKYQLEGYVEGNTSGQLTYAWSRFTDDAVWVREPWKTVMITSQTGGRAPVHKVVGSTMGDSADWRLEVVGVNGVITTVSRGYRTCVVD